MISIIRETITQVRPGERIIRRETIDPERIGGRLLDKYRAAAIDEGRRLDLEGVPFGDPRRVLLIESGDAADLDLIGGTYLFGLRLVAPGSVLADRLARREQLREHAADLIEHAEGLGDAGLLERTREAAAEALRRFDAEVP